MAAFGAAETAENHQIPVFDSDDIIARSFRQEGSEWHPVVRVSQVPGVGFEGGATHAFHAICLPLLVGSRAVGILYADHRTNRVQMSPQRLLGVQMFANTVATVIESTRLIAEVGRLADQDSMTGLANRRALTAVLRREVLRAARHDLPISVLMIDIDKFKKINDEYGHLAGDQAIIATAQVLRSATRETDFVSRYGGDEFCVVMPDTDEAHAILVRDRILEVARAKASDLNRSRWKYSLSLGVRSARGAAAEELLHEADKALYEHKEAQVRSGILQTLLVTTPDELGNWNHQLGRVLRVLYEKEPHYHSHALRVMNMCVAVAMRANWAQDDLECVSLAALLHDVGKISIPTSILTRPGPLSPREYRLIQEHPKTGRDLLKDVPYLGEVVELVASHHERWDGNKHCEFPAYPGELSGDRIPAGARLIKLADSFDAMTSPRPYSTPVSSRRAMEILREESGRSFDPDLTRHMLEWLQECESRPLIPVQST
jgi:diguanylate cyclase (GGDEF)-like protein